jgi:hypothetical protein
MCQASRRGEVRRQHVRVKPRQLLPRAILSGRCTDRDLVFLARRSECPLGGSVALGDIGDPILQRPHHHHVRRNVDGQRDRQRHKQAAMFVQHPAAESSVAHRAFSAGGGAGT